MGLETRTYRPTGRRSQSNFDIDFDVYAEPFPSNGSPCCFLKTGFEPITYSMELSPSWEAVSSEAAQKFPNML
jgi:hypothetical protein